jgi:hypothetical protein
MMVYHLALCACCSCIDVSGLSYGPTQGDGDTLAGTLPSQISEGVQFVEKKIYDTAVAAEQKNNNDTLVSLLQHVR